MKTTLIRTIVALGLLSSAAGAQTYKPDYATKLVLAGSGTSTTATITHNAVTPSASITYTWPDVPGTAGFVLASTTTGGLSWVNPATAANAWSLTGNASSATNFLGTTDATNPLLIKTNSATRVSIDGAGTIAVTAFTTAGVVHNAVTTGDLSSSLIVDGDITVGTIANDKLANSSVSFTSTTGTLSVPASIALGASGNFEIDLTNANTWTGTQTFGNAVINGGSIDATTVGLTTPSTVNTTGLTMSSTTSPITLNADPGTSGQVLTSAGPGATPSWTNPGAVILLGTSSPAAFAVDQDPMPITSTESYYRISSSAPISIKGISGGAAGRMIILANVGTNTITLTHNNATTVTDGFKLQNTDSIILGADGTVTLVYDGTDSRWRATANY